MALQRFLRPSTLLATDGDSNAVKAARANIRANGCDEGLSVSRLRWGDSGDIDDALSNGVVSMSEERDHHNAQAGRFDLVFMSDVTYWPAPLDLLHETIVKLVESENGTVIVAHKDRSKSNGRDFFDGFLEDLSRAFGV